MTNSTNLPRVLVIDDLYGREVSEGRNDERADLCAKLLLKDVTSAISLEYVANIKEPTAEAMFYRGQSPLCASIGDTVENDVAGTLEVIRKGWYEVAHDQPRWSLVLLDLCFYTGRVTQDTHSRTSGMPEGRASDDMPSSYFGIKLLKEIRGNFPELPVVLLSSMERDQVARDYSRLGALGFLPKADKDAADLLRKTLWREGLFEDFTGRIIGRSLPLLKVLRDARRAAFKRNNLLIVGETGTGKELIAPYLHEQGDPQNDLPFLTLNCGAFSTELFSSELFGHSKGSFTGALSDKKGSILLADRGDLFLDEIGNMPYAVQEGVLRAIEQKVISPVGSSVEIKVDVRFLSATNAELEDSDRFRPDLYARLREGGIIRMPSLRERMDDIPLLVEYFVRQAESLEPDPVHRKIEDDVIYKLSEYDWHRYNIRELRNVIYDAVNQYAALEHLSSTHVVLPSNNNLDNDKLNKWKNDEQSLVHTSSREKDITWLTSQIKKFSFDGVSVTELAGRLPELEEASAELLANYLCAILKATLQPTVDNPEGEIRIHPALKLATGDSKLTATKAADRIKKILSKLDVVMVDRGSDKILIDAMNTALRLRPKNGRKPK